MELVVLVDVTIGAKVEDQVETMEEAVVVVALIGMSALDTAAVVVMGVGEVVGLVAALQVVTMTGGATDQRSS